MVTMDSLTDTEVNDLTQQLCEFIASQRAWQLCEDSSLFRIEGDLLLNLVVFYSERQNGLSISLQYKMFEDDDLFWKILEIEYEEQAKMKMRLLGGFRAPFLEVLDNVLEINDWTLVNLQQQIQPTLLEIENKANELVAKIKTEQDHLTMIDDYIEEHFQKHPRSTSSSPYYLQILCAVRTGQWSTAENIIRQRLALGRGSGVSTEKGSFYELAYQYLHTIGRTSPEDAPLVVESSPFKNKRKLARFEAIEKTASDIMTEAVEDFGETDESVYWVEIYLMDAKPDRHADLVEIFGAWLGQYLIRQLDGAWSKSALGWGVSVVPDKLFYPFAQVEKFLQSGQSESLCQFVKEVRQNGDQKR